MSRLVAGLLLAGTLATGAAHADSLGDVRTGNAAFGDGRYEAAVEAFTRAILAGDLDHEALAITLNNRGVAYSELGDYDRAIADYQQGLALVPGDPTATRNLGSPTRAAPRRRPGSAIARPPSPTMIGRLSWSRPTPLPTCGGASWRSSVGTAPPPSPT